MKICILSMQQVENFGSLLQSYALKKMLEEEGHRVSFIDIERKENDNLLLAKKQVFYDEMDQYNANSFLMKLKKMDRFIFNRISNKKQMKKQMDKFLAFRRNILNISDSDNEKVYDLCIIGSDEVFNCMAESPWGFTSQLFGNVRQAERVITYAASCGFTSIEMLPKKVREKIGETFMQISAFSVRDANTLEFVSKLTKHTVKKHCDPVVVADFSNEIRSINSYISLPKRYCIVYSYGNRIHKKDEIDAIKFFCKKENMEIVTVGSSQMWTRNHIVLNPFEMLYCFSNAEFVITDTFHGTIFASKYSKRFATLIRDSNRNKLLDLIETLGIEEHLVQQLQDLDKVYNVEKNSENINEIVDIQRKRTKDYLEEQIK